LFSSDAAYYETPNDEPMKGYSAIHHYWSEGARDGQAQVTFEFALISFERDRGYAHWKATFIRIPSQEYVELDGIL
jgi:hypothetical protein